MQDTNIYVVNDVVFLSEKNTFGFTRHKQKI